MRKMMLGAGVSETIFAPKILPATEAEQLV